MIKFTGRCHFKQYIANKSISWGLKVFALADSVTNYIYNWKLYEGKEGNTVTRDLA